jgi:predicted nucleic acid-binding Zn ribbon protein
VSGDVPDDRPDPAAEADDEPERAAAAARTALQRARAAAAARGLRPGSRARGTRATPAATRTPPSGDRDDREPQAIGTGLERLVADRGWQVDVAVGGVMGRWPRVVGPEVAAHCVPVTFDDGVLVVRADSTAWATQVRLLVPTLLRRLAEELGDDVVTQVQVRGPASPSWRRGSRTVRGRGPRDTYG